MHKELHGERRVPIAAHASLALLLLFTIGAGCGGADGKFAAETDDEYTEPLTGVTIGEFARSGAGGGAVSAPATGTGGAFGGTVGAGTGGAGDTGGSPGGIGVDGGVGGGFGPSGFWHFDDCSPSSNFLLDSSGNGAN